MKEISFIILHYKTIQDTIKCIDSIINNISYKNWHIVVVDNGSKDGSGEELLNIYHNNNQIDIIFSNVNSGFSRGNNLGCEFALNKYNSDFLCVINNDTVIKQVDFVESVLNEYEKSEFDVLGPNIITINNKNQNPYNTNLCSYKAIRKHLVKMVLLRYYYKFNLDKFKILKGYKFVRKIFGNSNSEELLSINPQSRQEDVSLHGSALIFSRKYINRYQTVFYNKMFMYSEEDFLNYRRLRDELKFVYSPEVVIYHKEYHTGSFHFPSDKAKRLFLYKHSFKSVMQLYRLMKRERFKFKK